MPGLKVKCLNLIEFTIMVMKCCYQLFLFTYVAIMDVDIKPKLKDLHNLIIPEYAAHWKTIGILLGISKGTVDEINRTYPSDATYCFNKLLRIWLETDTSASWKKIIQVIDSPAMVVLTTSDANTVYNSPQVFSGSYLVISYLHKPLIKCTKILSYGRKPCCNCDCIIVL